jgi:beta-lactam-binding protein with PASTA domain
MRFIHFDFDAIEDYVSNHLRLFLSMTGGIIVFVGIIAVSVFFIYARGAEQTMVPDVRGKELTGALMELQVKELYPRLQLRYSQSSAEKGLILEQSPPAGTIVKAGRRIRLVVSQGVMVNTVENYVGRDIDEVRMDIQALFAAPGSASPPILSLREPFMYEYSSETPGTILRQKPEPGAGISGPTVLELVVSRGAENAMIKVPSLAGLPMADALEQIGRTGVDFVFRLRTARGSEAPGMVVFQDPPADTVAAANIRISLTVSAPEQPVTRDGEVFSLFRYQMAPNLYPLSIRLDALLPAAPGAAGNRGERRRLLTTDYAGGELTVPYLLPEGSVLILSMLNREIHRETVILPVNDLSLEQL